MFELTRLVILNNLPVKLQDKSLKIVPIMKFEYITTSKRMVISN